MSDPDLEERKWAMVERIANWLVSGEGEKPRTILHEGDSRDVLRGMIERGEMVDSVVCDPPYGLVSVTKRFGSDAAAPAKPGTDGAFVRQSRGFMGKTWDGSAIERDPQFWGLVLQVMKPGAYIVAFSSSRTYHHMAVAMEQAGFITHPMIGWTFASGFPKAHNAARAIDKALGVEGAVTPQGDPVRRIRPGADQNKDGTWEKLDDREYQPGAYAPGSPEAQQWEGWHYGGQARKPALEPIYVGQKPFSEKNGALNILKHGVGAVNIDGCRVPAEKTVGWGGARGGSDDPTQSRGRNYRMGEGEPRPAEGRWPANLIHDGSPEVVALFPDNAARFFESYPFEGRPIFHYPKASKKDRAGSRHPTVKPIALMRALIRHVTPPYGVVLDPFAGSGTTGQAAIEEGMRCILIEREAEYAADIRRRLGMPAVSKDESDLTLEDLLG